MIGIKLIDSITITIWREVKLLDKKETQQPQDKLLQVSNLVPHWFRGCRNTHQIDTI